MTQITTGMPSPSRFGVALPLVVALFVYATVLAKGSGVLNDQDPYLHIALGRWIIVHGTVPQHDVFSNSMRGAPWVPHEWLAEVTTAWLYDRFGWSGLVAATALCFAAALALLARALLRYLPPGPALIGVVAAWGLAFPHLLARPHVFSLLLLVPWIAALVAARAKNRAPSPMLALLMVPWANLHGGYLSGLALAALFAGEATFEAPDWRAALRATRGWGLFGALSLAAALVTPHGLQGVLAPLQLVGMDFALSWVNEWQSPNFQQFQPLEAWLLLVLLAALFLGLRLPVTRIAMLLVLLHMALVHQRHGELLGLVAPLLVAPALAPQLRRRALGRELAPLGRRLAVLLETANAGRLALAGALVLAAGASAWRLPIAHEKNRFTPTAALAAVEAHRVTGPVLNDYNFGGYLIFAGIAPFIDGRNDLYGDEFIKRYSKTGELPQLLQQYKTAWTLFGATSPRVTLLDYLPGWRRLYADDVAVVHVREGEAATR